MQKICIITNMTDIKHGIYIENYMYTTGKKKRPN